MTKTFETREDAFLTMRISYRFAVSACSVAVQEISRV
jgi:hypothetical protein